MDAEKDPLLIENNNDHEDEDLFEEEVVRQDSIVFGDKQQDEKKEELDGKRMEKRREIDRFLRKNLCVSGYVDKLREFAKSAGGLIDDDIRKRAWPLLLELRPEDMDFSGDESDYKSHAEYSQVVLDVNRAIRRFPPGIPYAQRVAMQDQLIRLILRVITKYPQLKYYQGYHDVAITFLLVVGENTAFYMLEKLSTHHLKHFMEATLEKTSELLEYVYVLLDNIHPELCSYISKVDVGTMFCLPWYLTWYSHTLTQYEHVMRLYDFFLASNPFIPLYLIPAIIIHREDHIFAAECELSALHQELSQLPENLPFDQLLLQADEYLIKYPPEVVQKEACIRRLNNQRELDNQKLARLRKSPTHKHVRGWTFMKRILPVWVLPYGRISFLIFSASLLLGLFAYFRDYFGRESVTQ